VLLLLVPAILACHSVNAATQQETPYRLMLNAKQSEFE